MDMHWIHNATVFGQISHHVQKKQMICLWLLIDGYRVHNSFDMPAFLSMPMF